MPTFAELLRKRLENIFNIFLFLPYYFNVEAHLKNLFSPWKRIVAVKTERGFSFSDYFERLSTNLISRAIGFLLRLGVIFSYLIVLAVYILAVAPLWFLFALFTLPFAYLLQQIFLPSQKKAKAKAAFVSSHLLEEQNRLEVEKWFEKNWQKKLQQQDIYSLDNLLSVPPIGRDWGYGFTPTLDQFCQELTADLGYKSVLIGRDKEVEMIERALVKSYEANAILVGEEGVGRRTIIEGLAQKIFEGRTSPLLQNMRVLELNMEKVLASRNSYEEKVALLQELLQEASLAKNIILVIPDFHKYCNQSLLGDFSAVWEKYGKTPYVKFLAVTTPFYYEQVIYQNDKVQRLFNKIVVEEISGSKALDILEDKVLLFEARYGLVIPYETLVNVVKRSQYYITNIPFPEKAISLLDEACVYAKEAGEKVVSSELVDNVLSQKTKVPIGKLSEEQKHKLSALEKLLGQEIYGQDEVVKEVAKAFRRAFIEEKRKKPRATFLFLGPTGVGKTETAKLLAKIFFGSKNNLIRFDMSYYQEKHALTDLTGSFESKNPGLLASRIRENPYAVLLIDEIEKAHRDLLNIFLTLLDEGYLLDGFGERIDCKNLIVIATSNAGAKEILSWVKDGLRGNVLERRVRELVEERGIFTPEFLNRFDKVLVFEPLTKEVAYKIASKVAAAVSAEYFAEKKLKVELKDEELAAWVNESFDISHGARDIERAVREKIADKIAGKILSKIA